MRRGDNRGGGARLAGCLIALAAASCGGRSLPLVREGIATGADAARSSQPGGLAGDSGADALGDCPFAPDECACAALTEARRVATPDPDCQTRADPLVAALTVCKGCVGTRVIPVIGNRGGLETVRNVAAVYTWTTSDGGTSTESIPEGVLQPGSLAFLPNRFTFTTQGSLEVLLQVPPSPTTDCVPSNDVKRTFVPAPACP